MSQPINGKHPTKTNVATRDPNKPIDDADLQPGGKLREGQSTRIAERIMQHNDETAPDGNCANDLQSQVIMQELKERLQAHIASLVNHACPNLPQPSLPQKPAIACKETVLKYEEELEQFRKSTNQYKDRLGERGAMTRAIHYLYSKGLAVYAPVVGDAQEDEVTTDGD